jgi:2-polyprenyl-3-methyl-5-hydroxy-6-metoxy-1,4-benzoquinol methylase
MSADRTPWNHNIHYHPLILAAVPDGCQRCLDVGCGEGLLARELRRVVPQVVGIDRDGPAIALARRQDAGGGVAYLRGDFLSHGFRPGSFDMIVSVAALHHMDPVAALTLMRDLLRPGGTLALVGLARSRIPADLPTDLAGVAAHRVLRIGKAEHKVAAPVLWPPPHTYPQIRRIAAQVLPGVRYRRRLLWRYSLLWTKPAHPPTGTCT